MDPFRCAIICIVQYISINQSIKIKEAFRLKMFGVRKIGGGGLETIWPDLTDSFYDSSSSFIITFFDWW